MYITLAQAFYATWPVWAFIGVLAVALVIEKLVSK